MAKSPELKRDSHNRLFYNPIKNYSVSGSASQSIGSHSAPRFELYVFSGDGKASAELGSAIGNSDVQLAAEKGKSLKRFVTSLEIEEDESMTSKLTLNMINLDFQISEKRLLNEGDHVVVDMGYGSSVTSNSNRFVLVRSHPSFPDNNVPTLTFIGYDGRYALISKDWIAKKRLLQTGPGQIEMKRRTGVAKGPRKFTRKTDSEIIDEIAYHYGYAIDVDFTSTKRTRTIPKGKSHWEFILTLAKANGYTTWVDWSKSFYTWVIHFRQRETVFTQGYEFTYKQNDSGTLLNFHPVRDSTRMITDIEVISFDTKRRKIDNQWLTYDDKQIPPPPVDKDVLNLSPLKETASHIKFKIGGRMIETWANRPFKNKQAAKDYATYLVNEHQTDFMPGQGRIIGVENVRPRQIHRLRGVSNYSGDYYFTQTKHSISADSFYVTDFTAYRIFDNSVKALLRRGQFTQWWSGSLIIANTSSGSVVNK
jgi:phage protein D